MPRSKSTKSATRAGASSSSLSSPAFWDHPIETLEEALSLRRQIEGLQRKLSQALGGAKAAVSEVVSGKAKGEAAAGGRRRMSPATLARMRAAQQKRWAEIKGKAVSSTSSSSSSSAPSSAKAGSPKKPAPVPAAKKKGGLTEEGRAKLAAAMKARWAARKKGGAAPNAPAK